MKVKRDDFVYRKTNTYYKAPEVQRAGQHDQLSSIGSLLHQLFWQL